MSKRKQKRRVDDDDAGDGDKDGDSDVSLIDVDFEFFDPNPSVDYLALKRLLAQLFQADAELFHLHELADLILSQPLLGTTVKTDGKESDPYAFLSVLNMHVHRSHPSIRALVPYVLLKSSANGQMHAALQSLIGPAGLESQNHVGFVFSERLINMPVQVVPPMYRMLSDEIKWANEEKEPYTFTHYLFLTRTYHLTPEEASAMEASRRPSKRPKNTPEVPTPPAHGQSTYSFHPEDEYIQSVALHVADYELSASQPREADAFGLDTAARMMLVPAARLPELIDLMNEAYAVPQ